MLASVSCYNLNLLLSMRQLFFLFALLGLTQVAQGQARVSNVRFSLNTDGILVTQYDVQGIAANDSVYLVANGLKSGKITPITINGDLGRRVGAGVGKTIYWDIVKDGYKINEDVIVTVLVKLVAGRLPQSAPTVGEVGTMRPTSPVANVQPVQQPPVPKSMPTQTPPVKTEETKVVRTEPAKPVETKKADMPPNLTQTPVTTQVKNLDVDPAPKKNEPAKVVAATPKPVSPVVKPTTPPPTKVVRKGGGPANALVSALLPGVGNIFVQPGHRVGMRPVVTLAYVGLLAYGVSQHSQSQTAYDAYKALPIYTEQATADDAYAKANNANHTAILCVAGAVTIWAIDVTATLLRGIKNQREGGISSRPPRTQFSIATVGPTPVLTFRHQF